MTCSFYSQHGEDALLARIFKDNSGICVEVGANDGITYSNTYYFEKIGWQCVLVEPTPHLCEKIRVNRKRSTLFECAASQQHGTAKLRIPTGADLYSSLESKCTMELAISSQKIAVDEISVATMPLDKILETSGVTSIDFITIDVEGHELAVLEGFTLDRWRPKVIIVEDATELGDTPVSSFLKAKKYVHFFRSGGNDWYAHPSESHRFGMLRLLSDVGWTVKGIAKARLPNSLKRTLTQIIRRWRARNGS